MLLKEGKPSAESASWEEAFEYARTKFKAQNEKLNQKEEEAKTALEFAFDFMEEAFGSGEEMIIFVTELTVSKEAAAFLAENECERYLLYNSQLLIGSRKGELLLELERGNR